MSFEAAATRTQVHLPFLKILIFDNVPPFYRSLFVGDGPSRLNGLPKIGTMKKVLILGWGLEAIAGDGPQVRWTALRPSHQCGAN
jgi:hypothetical protein